jgi:hypothetical protein
VRREAVEAEEGKEDEAVTLTSLSDSTFSLASSE